MELDHVGLISDLLDESDLCRNEGVEDLADLRGACMSEAMEMTK